MKKTRIEVKDLTPDDLVSNWLYKFVPSRSGALTVVPVYVKKTAKFAGKMVACKVEFANKSEHWALIEGLDLEVPEFSRHHREIHIFLNDSGWFQLAQYFDGPAIKAIRGEEVLARKMGLSLSEIFPIHFDVRDRSNINSDCLRGDFEINPTWGRSLAEIMSLLVEEISKK